MVSAHRLAVTPLLNSFIVLVFAFEKSAITSNRLLGILGCKLDCFGYGSCSHLLYNIDMMCCSLFFNSRTDDGKPKNIIAVANTFEFQCVTNICKRHEKSIITKRGTRKCVALGRKIRKKVKSRPERTIIWNIPHMFCIYDYVTKKKQCEKTKWLSIEAIDTQTGDMYIMKYSDTIERRKVLNKNVDYRRKVKSWNFHFFTRQRVVFFDENMVLHVATKTFKDLPCKYKAKCNFEMTVDTIKKMVMLMCPSNHGGTMLVKFDPVSCKKVSKFKLRQDVISSFIVKGGKLFFCSLKGVEMMNLRTKHRKTVSKKCSLIFENDFSIFALTIKNRDIIKLDSNGKFLGTLRLPTPNDGISFLQFTKYSLLELKKMSALKN